MEEEVEEESEEEEEEESEEESEEEEMEEGEEEEESEEEEMEENITEEVIEETYKSRKNTNDIRDSVLNDDNISIASEDIRIRTIKDTYTDLNRKNIIIDGNSIKMTKNKDPTNTTVIKKVSRDAFY